MWHRAGLFSRQKPVLSKRRILGVGTTEYILSLSLTVLVGSLAYKQYGPELRQHAAKMSERFATYYYEGWFWPEDDLATGGGSGTPRAGSGTGSSGSPSDGAPSSPGSSGGGNPLAGGNGSSSAGEGGGSSGETGNGGSGGSGGNLNNGNSNTSGNTTPGNNLGNSGGAGGEPQMCSVGGGNPGNPLGSPSTGSAANASSFSSVGNPIDLGTGNKYQIETDYNGAGTNPLAFTRSYNSVLADRDTGLGHGWRYSYQRSLVIDQAKHLVTVWRDDGTQYPFTLEKGNADALDTATAPVGVIDRLERAADGWTYRTASGDTERYDTDGRLQQIDYASGQRHHLTYASDDRLQSITDHRGQRLTLHWGRRHLSAVTTPTGERLHYRYDDHNNLQAQHRSRSVIQRALNLLALGSPERRYHYEDKRHDHALTGLNDASGARYATWGYDHLGRANLSQHGDGAEKITLDYRDFDARAQTRTVALTNAAGHTVVYTLEAARPGKYRLRDIDGQPGLDCPAVQNHHRYDDHGFLARQYNADRIGSTYNRNARGLIEQETHGLRFDERENHQPVAGSTRIERTYSDLSDSANPARLLTETHTSWQIDATHPQGHWQPVIARTLTYDEDGRVLTDTQTDLTDQTAPYQTYGTTRTQSYAYTWHDAAKTDLASLTVTDGNGHATTYHYQHEQLQRLTNALQQTTHFSDYTEVGQPRRIQLPNGQTLHITYNAQGLPTQLRRLPAPDESEQNGHPETTEVTYDASGRLRSVSRPDGSEQTYSYNGAGQLTQIKNGWGETLDLTPHALHGQWEAQILSDAEGRLLQRHNRHFNGLGQLVAVLRNTGQQTTFDYDASGNLIAAREGDEDPANADSVRTTAARYDTQHRLLALIDAAGYLTRYSHSASGAIDAITTTDQNTTEYLRNGFGDIIQQTSPITGGVARRYDGNGNLIANQSPSGAEVHFTYDRLNRLTKIDYPGETQDITYTYDQTDKDHGHGLQQLTRVDTHNQTIDYRYDGLGRKVGEITSEKEAGKVTTRTTLQYSYLPGNRLHTLTHPDGSIVTYHYDQDRVEEVTYRDAATDQQTTVLADIAYTAFGGPVAWTYGNGLTQRRTLDLDGRVKAIDLTADSFTERRSLWSQCYTYDKYHNIAAIQRQENSSEPSSVQKQEQRFGYDAVDRLIEEVIVAPGHSGDNAETTLQTQKGYHYDGAGNRLGAHHAAIAYDAIGNIETARTADGERRYVYNAHNRPAALYDHNELQALYGYNALGWRQEKRTYRHGERQRTRYVHAAAGKLLSEQREAQATILAVNYIWLGAVPIAQVERVANNEADSSGNKQTSTILYLHTDHLTAPRLVSDADQRIVWRWHSDAFGNGAPEEDPDQDGQVTQINLRFAGQYADTESGLYYNLHRYYDPQTGRYTQSDPLGLLPSLNSYSYVDANPVSWLDPLGLAKLQYVLIDSFGGNPADSSKSTLKAGTDKRMIHFAFRLYWDENPAWSKNPAGYNEALLYDPLGIETQTKNKGYYQFNPLGVHDGPWQQFLNFYRNGYGGNNAVNTGDWAVADIGDNDAAELFKQITGNYPEGYTPSGEGCDKPMNTLLPNLPQGFKAMEHFNFPTIVHKLDKAIFDVAQLPGANDAMFDTFPWHDSLTKPAEAPTLDIAKAPHWPGSSSGITLGRGFDLGAFTSNKQTILKALDRVGIKDKLITDAAGLKGADAGKYWKAHEDELKNSAITAEQQYLLSLYAFEAKETNINKIDTSAAKSLYETHVMGNSGVKWYDLEEPIRDVLFDLNYRGDWTGISSHLQDVLFEKNASGQLIQSKTAKKDLCQFMHEKFWTAVGQDASGDLIFDSKYDEKLDDAGYKSLEISSDYGGLTPTSRPAMGVPPDRFGRRAVALEINGECQ